MSDVKEIAGILGASAAFIGLVTAARSLIMLLFPEKKFKTVGIRQKQALLADSAKNYEWWNNLGLGVLAGAAMTLTGDILKIGSGMEWALNIAIATSWLVTWKGILALTGAYRNRKLGKALEEKGFDVCISHKANVNWCWAMRELAHGAGNGTVSMIRIHSHGSRVSKESFEFKEMQRVENANYSSHAHNFMPDECDRKKVSVLDNGEMPDYALISMLSELHGKKVLLVNACQAGGMVEATKRLSGNEKDDISLMTCTGRGLGLQENPQARSFIRYLKQSQGSMPVSEFFEKHCKKHSGWRKFVRPYYRPVQFSGKNMRITL